MLDLIRKHRTLFMIIFLVSAVGMVITMFGTPGQGGMGGGMGFSTNVAAKVDGEEISTNELMGALNRQMEQMQEAISEQVKNAPNKAEARKFLEQIFRAQVTPDRVLDQMIQEKFRVVTADRAGIEAPADAIRDKIQSNPVFYKNGHFDPLMYKQMVQPGTYEKAIAMQTKMEELGRVFESGLGLVSPHEEKLDKMVSESHSYETLTVNPRSFPEPKSVSDAEVKAFLADASSNAKLQAYYDRNLAKFQQDEQVHARHILVRESEGGEKKIQEIANEIKSGKISFADAAKKYSADKSNAQKGGDLGFFGKGAMDPAFEKAAFELKDKDAISGPVKSSFGFHLIQLVERKPANKQSFDQVKAQIAPEVLLEEKRAERAREWVKAIASSGKLPSDAEIKRLGLTWTKAQWSPMDEMMGSAPVQGHVTELVSLTPANPVLKNSLTQGDSLVVVRRVPDTATAKKDDPKSPAAASESNKKPTLAKAENAFGFYLRNRFENLQKSNKIVRSESLLASLREQMDASSGR